jgi:ADP-ribose pyrophosphatase YjhB (NUDIX family)
MINHSILAYIKRVQAIAQAGLTYTENGYDLERYEELRRISAELMSLITDEPIQKIRGLFTNETGYQTPKVDIRAVVFENNKILLVKEKSDNCWSLPGGWADIGYSPGEVAVKETKEESGLDVMPEKLLAVLDKNKHPHPPSPYYTYKIFIGCAIIGGVLNKGLETSDVGFFSIDEIPPLSEERLTKSQITRLFEQYHNSIPEIIFD